MTIRKALRIFLRRIKRWLEEPEKQVPPFDNRPDWIGASFERLMRDPVCARRPALLWGLLQGVALGKVLGMARVSVIEFGVAGGAGLLALERAAEAVEDLLAIRIDVYGFDTGTGIPKSQDYRDCPNIWLDGQFPMDKERLERQLRRASLKLGRVENTVPEFVQSAPAPIAFVSFDLDLYTATQEALRLFEAPFDSLLPRVLCYFDDIFGLTYSDFNGERLAISEFNSSHTMRKISPLYGLKFFVPGNYRLHWWPESFFFAHFFDHPLYNEPDELRKPMIMDVDGNVTGWIHTDDKRVLSR